MKRFVRIALSLPLIVGAGLLFEASAAERAARRAPRSSAPAAVELHHAAGSPLVATDLYRVYQKESRWLPWCQRGEVFLVAVFDVGEDYTITNDQEYKDRFEREIAPVVLERCPDVRLIGMSHYVKGVRIGRYNTEHSYDDESFEGPEQPLSAISIRPDGRGGWSYERTAWLGTSLVDRRERVAREKRRRAALPPSDAPGLEEAARADAARIAQATTSRDGRLKLDGIDAEHKLLFLQIYDEDFIELTRPDKENYLPYQMYTALIQGYDKYCRARIVDPVRVDFFGERHLRTDYGPFVTTKYYEEYLAGTVHVERKYEAAYRTASATYLSKLAAYFARNLPGEDLVQFYMMQSVRGIALAMASHRLVKMNGCSSPGLLQFMDTLHRYVTGNWSTRKADGSYRYSETESPGVIERRYERVPPEFSPDFPIPRDKEIAIWLNKESGRPGLYLVQVNLFNVQPYRRKEIDIDFPAFIEDAIDERKYQVATCSYLTRSGGSVSHFYWNANAAEPSAEVQRFTQDVIGSPRRSCPIMVPE